MHRRYAANGARVIAFGGLGMEAIHEFDVVEFPKSVHQAGSAKWRAQIGALVIVLGTV